MTDLGDECGHAPDPDDLKPLHRRVEDRCKNAGFGAGVREYLQQLLRGDGHAFLQTKINPHLAGIGVAVSVTGCSATSALADCTQGSHQLWVDREALDDNPVRL